MNKRAKACAISSKVRQEVKERDGGRCIFCGNNYTISIAHYISRAKGGLGIKENLTCACFKCHDQLDHGKKKEREEKQAEQRAYLSRLYPNFTDEQRKFKKWKSNEPGN